MLRYRYEEGTKYVEVHSEPSATGEIIYVCRLKWTLPDGEQMPLTPEEITVVKPRILDALATIAPRAQIVQED